MSGCCTAAGLRVEPSCHCLGACLTGRVSHRRDVTFLSGNVPGHEVHMENVFWVFKGDQLAACDEKGETLRSWLAPADLGPGLAMAFDANPQVNQALLGDLLRQDRAVVQQPKRVPNSLTFVESRSGPSHTRA